MNNVAPRYISDSVLEIDLDNMQANDLVCQAYTLSRATQERFAAVMGVHRVTLARYLSGASQPTHVVACAAAFAAMCFGVSMRIPRVTIPTKHREKPGLR
jgi:transcriptional regulator with XRE-family HTH domain